MKNTEYAERKSKKKNKNEKSTWLPQIEPTLNCLALCVYQFFSLFSFFVLYTYTYTLAKET